MTDCNTTIIPPAIILDHPQLGENIGAAARVMHNFGLLDLRLVAPRDPWPNKAANAMAAGALNIIEQAVIYPTMAEACADLQYLFVTSARPRDMQKKVYTPDQSKEKITTLHQQNSRYGFIFGPERTGVDNEVIALADAIISINVNPEYKSLNLAQTVAILCYEWSQLELLENTHKNADHVIAPKAMQLGLFEHLEEELDKRNFYSVYEKKGRIIRNLRTMLTRAELTEQEIKTLRGIIRCLCEHEPR